MSGLYDLVMELRLRWHKFQNSSAGQRIISDLEALVLIGVQLMMLRWATNPLTVRTLSLSDSPLFREGVVASCNALILVRLVMPYLMSRGLEQWSYWQDMQALFDTRGNNVPLLAIPLIISAAVSFHYNTSSPNDGMVLTARALPSMASAVFVHLQIVHIDRQPYIGRALLRPDVGVVRRTLWWIGAWGLALFILHLGFLRSTDHGGFI